MEKMPVVVVLDNVRSAQNVGAFFRTGDAFAVEKIALCGITATPPSREIHKSSLGAEFSVEWTHFPTTVECVQQLKSEGYTIVAIEQIAESVMLDKFEPVAGTKYALVFGNEFLYKRAFHQIRGFHKDLQVFCNRERKAFSSGTLYNYGKIHITRLRRR